MQFIFHVSVSRYRSGVEDDVFVTEDGSYVFPNITKADEKYANATGVVYYCTATNDFGTIRSPNVRAFYACEWERGCGFPTHIIVSIHVL